METYQIAAVVFGLLLLGLSGFVGWRIWRSELTAFQCVLWFLAYLLVRFWWRAELPQRAPLEKGQGAIIICNHRSSVDPFFVQVASDHKVHWMVAREYCESLAFGWFLRACEVIPVSRGGIDTAATKLAIRVTKAGGFIGMFPEGRINMTDEFMLPGRPGAALVALKAKAAILPCYIEGSPYNKTTWSPFLMRARVKVHFGQPIDLSEYAGREHEEGVVQEIMLRGLKALAELAGRPDFEPQLAGRSWKPTEAQIAADIAASDERRKRDS